MCSDQPPDFCSTFPGGVSHIFPLSPSWLPLRNLCRPVEASFTPAPGGKPMLLAISLFLPPAYSDRFKVSLVPRDTSANLRASPFLEMPEGRLSPAPPGQKWSSLKLQEPLKATCHHKGETGSYSELQDQALPETRPIFQLHEWISSLCCLCHLELGLLSFLQQKDLIISSCYNLLAWLAVENPW